MSYSLCLLPLVKGDKLSFTSRTVKLILDFFFFVGPMQTPYPVR